MLFISCIAEGNVCPGREELMPIIGTADVPSSGPQTAVLETAGLETGGKVQPPHPIPTPSLRSHQH